ncbi:MAG: 5'-methylthioadenosine/S-adenosylhomocysteine nucleosidase [Treponema sp.]|jgi:adenosylhomocysteine nucleosidase|nr:5'-methylthioadenosine/S-adenosylhomocysteine nucleosidase [Treponema sp.]
MIGIIGAMDEEVELLRSGMTNLKVETPEDADAFEFYTGELEGKPVVLLRCGIGKVNAAVGCALLLLRYKPDFVVNTGSAGGIDPCLTFGDAIISDGLVYHDVDVTAFNYAPGQVPKMPAVYPVPEDLIKRAETAVDTLKKEGALPNSFNHVRGLIGSGDTFMHDPSRIAQVRALFPAIKAVEMEGAAIAHTCFLFKTPTLIIRALSDIAGVESPVALEQFLPVAAKHSAEIVKRLVSGC